MTQTTDKRVTLEEFLRIPETKPGCEYIEGEIIQKPMPKGRHSRLQGKLCSVINQVTEDAKIAYAFPELRCTFEKRSIIPDVAVFRWSRIPFTSDGEVPDRFNLPPDWIVEILSPEQKSNKVIGNILYGLNHGCLLGWFIDPDDASILVFRADQQPELMEGNDSLPILPDIPLELRVNQVFSWLKMGI
ncbi:MAG: Uma2 family endonuclease [Cyanobacteria bacterium J06592_8]